MKQLSMMAALMGTAALTTAQPVLTFPANVPAWGTGYTIHHSVYHAPGSTGANQTWDLSMLTSDSTTQVQHVAPAATPQGASFPAATLAQSGADVSVYFRAASDGLYLLGTHAEELLIINSDEAKQLPFPCTYQTSWTDQSASEFILEGFDNHRTSTISATADGYGSVSLPSGTLNDVLRIHWQEAITDSMDFFTFTTVNESYIFYSASHAYPVAQVTTTTLSIFGQTDTIRSADWVEDIGTAVSTVEDASAQLDLYPVPASDILHFAWPAAMNGEPVVSITDAQGRTVRNRSTLRMQGGTGRLDLGELAPGIYQFTAIDQQGHRAVRSFIKQ